MEELYYQAPKPHSRHHTSRIFVVGGALLIIILGIFVAQYWHTLVAPPPTALPGTPVEAPPRQYTASEKAQLLQSLQESPASDEAQASSTAAERAQVLQQVSADNNSQASPQPSTAEKMKLLQSLQQ